MALQEAQAAERAFLEEATELEAVTGVNDESSSDDIESAIGNAVIATVGDDSTQGTVVGELTDLATALTAAGATPAAATITAYAGSFAGASPAVKAEIVAEAQAEATKLVQAAQNEVAKISGQLSKVNALVSAKAAYEAALDANGKAKPITDAELAKFNGLNSGVTATITRTDAASFVVTDTTAGDLIDVDNGVLKILDAGKSLEGIDAMFTAAQAEYQALLAVESGETNFEARLISARNGESDAADITAVTAGTDYAITGNEITLNAVVTDEMPDSVALLAARGVETELADAVSNYQAIAQVAADLAVLATDVEAAADAIEELGVELATVTPGTAGAADSAAGTDADDLFVFTGNDLNISGFGLEGVDLLFIGEGFAEVRVAAGDNAVTDRLGSASELELLFQQDGNNTIIYVEQEAFAGNATNADDLATITLQGVNIDDLQYENGYITVA